MPTPLTPITSSTIGEVSRRGFAAHQVDEDAAHGLPGLRRVVDLVPLAYLPQLIRHLLAGLNPHVGHNQDVGKVLVEVVLQGMVRALLHRGLIVLHQLVHLSGDVLPGLKKRILDLVKQSP